MREFRAPAAAQHFEQPRQLLDDEAGGGDAGETHCDCHVREALLEELEHVASWAHGLRRVVDDGRGRWRRGHAGEFTRVGDQEVDVVGCVEDGERFGVDCFAGTQQGCVVRAFCYRVGEDGVLGG